MLKCNILFCRSGFYHREVCVDNVYLPWGEIEEEIAYGEAKLSFSARTRLVYDPYFFDQTGSLPELKVSVRFFCDYMLKTIAFSTIVMHCLAIQIKINNCKQCKTITQFDEVVIIKSCTDVVHNSRLTDKIHF